MYGDSGLKNDFGGHHNYHTSNLYAYIANAWGFCCISGADDVFADNSVVLRDDNGYNSNCDLPPGTDGMQVMRNEVFVPSGRINGNGKVCRMTFEKWQEQGNDPGTTIHAIPSDENIIKMARALLDDN